jgi:copper(I)-binding protein
MHTLKLKSAFLTLIFSICVQAAFAHQSSAGDIHIAHPHARASLPGQRNGSVYLTLENRGTSSDRLTAVSTPVAGTAAIHTMSMQNNVMKMREAAGIDMPPRMKMKMIPGEGHHIMLLNLKRALKPGEKFPMTLVFEKAGKVDVSVAVDQVQSTGAMPHAH